MGITRTKTQVQWSAADTKSVTSATEVESDVFTLDDTCIAASIQLYVENAGTPASGDTAVWRIKWSNGDTKANTGDDYDTVEHAQYLITIDTFASNTPGENPSLRTLAIAPLATKFKLSCVCAQAATRNITIAARVDEQRFA
jgi:hypothetical protein